MKKLLSLLLIAGASFISNAQTGVSSGTTNAVPGITKEYTKQLLKIDQQMLHLTPEQMVKGQIVYNTYAEKFNAMVATHPGIEAYKVQLKKLNVDRVHAFKEFLTADQYNKVISGYNRLHPTSTIN